MVIYSVPPSPEERWELCRCGYVSPLSASPGAEIRIALRGHKPDTNTILFNISISVWGRCSFSSSISQATETCIPDGASLMEMLSTSAGCQQDSGNWCEGKVLLPSHLSAASQSVFLPRSQLPQPCSMLSHRRVGTTVPHSSISAVQQLSAGCTPSSQHAASQKQSSQPLCFSGNSKVLGGLPTAQAG